MKALPGLLIVPLLAVFAATDGHASGPLGAGKVAPGQYPRLHLTTHSGSLRIFPPYPTAIDPFRAPWPHADDRFGVAGAVDLIRTPTWRFGVQVEGIYSRYDLPFLMDGNRPWRRRLVIYGTYVGEGWVVTVGIPVHDTGPRERLRNVVAASNRGAAARDFISEIATRRGHRGSAAKVSTPADMRKVRPQDDVLIRRPGRSKPRFTAKKRAGASPANW